MGVGDREIRALIGELVAEGHLICAASDHPMGYFIPDDPGQVERYAATLKARGTKILKRLSTISKSAAREFLQEQVELFK